MNDIYLQNTLTGKKELFKPKNDVVGIYSCGPTVYDYAHIGNFRSFLMADILTRTMRLAGYKVIKVQNITDVGHLTADDMADASGEDKISKKARLELKSPIDIADYYMNAFIEDEEFLRIEKPDDRPRATDFINEQIEMAKTLIDNGYAYVSNGSVYFRTAKYKDYGKLSKNNLDKLSCGCRVEVNSEKEDPLDFALWKKAGEEHLMQWDSPWGKGFPGWHIECSAMGNALLPDGIDIHTGGEDNIFPHHECEIAQNECSGHGEIPYWLHAKHLLVDGTKMSKSKGNFYTIRDLKEKGYTGSEIRLALLFSHYRSTQNFQEKDLIQARKNIKKIKNVLSKGTIFQTKNRFKKQYRKEFMKKICDDLNTPAALAVIFDMISAVKKNNYEIDGLDMNDFTATMNMFNKTFDIL